MTIPDLIARLRLAREGTRDLDEDIAAALGVTWFSDEEGGQYGPYNIMPRRVWFTRSLDAALTLVPDGALYNIGHAGDAQPGVFLGVVVIPAVGRGFHAYSVVEPIALVIAALEARL